MWPKHKKRKMISLDFILHWKVGLFFILGFLQHKTQRNYQIGFVNHAIKCLKEWLFKKGDCFFSILSFCFIRDKVFFPFWHFDFVWPLHKKRKLISIDLFFPRKVVLLLIVLFLKQNAKLKPKRVWKSWKMVFLSTTFLQKGDSFSQF